MSELAYIADPIHAAGMALAVAEVIETVLAGDRPATLLNPKVVSPCRP